MKKMKNPTNCPEVQRWVEAIYEDQIHSIQSLFHNFTSSTYPIRTLRRRIELLTPREQTRLKAIYEKIEKLSEKAELIISNRAERAGDKWP